MARKGQFIFSIQLCRVCDGANSYIQNDEHPLISLLSKEEQPTRKDFDNEHQHQLRDRF